MSFEGKELYDQFAKDLADACGKRMKESDQACEEIWASLTNVRWFYKDGKEECSFSFRSAARLIANIIDRGDYMDWYCCGPYGVVADWITEAMKEKGWNWRLYGTY